MKMSPDILEEYKSLYLKYAKKPICIVSGYKLTPERIELSSDFDLRFDHQNQQRYGGLEQFLSKIKTKQTNTSQRGYWQSCNPRLKPIAKVFNDKLHEPPNYSAKVYFDEFVGRLKEVPQPLQPLAEHLVGKISGSMSRAIYYEPPAEIGDSKPVLTIPVHRDGLIFSDRDAAGEYIDLFGTYRLLFVSYVASPNYLFSDLCLPDFRVHLYKVDDDNAVCCNYSVTENDTADWDY